MVGGTTRKSYTKIKNFTEKNQVRVKYSHIGKDKKLMLSVYIGEDVYNELTDGQNFKRLKVEYIPNDMVIITPTDNEKEGIVHRYNGKGLFKTTCVRLSLSSYKKLKISKKDFNNRVVDYLFASRSDGKCLNVDLIGNKRKSTFIHDNTIREIINLHDVVPQDYVSKSKIKPLEISAPDYQDMPSREYIDEPTPMFVSHDFLNDVRDAIENRLLDMEERFEKRINNLELKLNKLYEHVNTDLHFKYMKLEKNVDALNNAVKINVDATPLKELDIDSFKKFIDKENNELSIKINKLEKQIVELVSKSVDLNSRLSLLLQELESRENCLKAVDTEYMSFRFSEIKELLNEIKSKSLFEKIFGKD